MADETPGTVQNEQQPAPAAANGSGNVTFTPEQMAEANRIAEERAQRASSSALKNYFQQQGMTEDEARKALELFKTQKAAEKTPEQLAQEAQQTANTRIAAAKQSLVKIAAQAAAARSGVKPERVAYVLKLADLSAVEVGDDMAVDEEKVNAVLKKVVDDLPELIGTVSSTPAANPVSVQTPAGKDNPWSKEGFNLTEQGRVLRSDPKLAAKLMAAAGITS